MTPKYKNGDIVRFKEDNVITGLHQCFTGEIFDSEIDEESETIYYYIECLDTESHVIEEADIIGLAKEVLG